MRNRLGGFLISKIHQSAGRIFARLLRERRIEINPAQGRVLFVLWEHGSMNIRDLARRVSLGKSTLTSTLDRLEAAGQVLRVPSREDRRQIRIELTQKNRDLHRQYEEVSLRMTELFYDGFSSEEIGQFEHSLQRILKNLELRESR